MPSPALTSAAPAPEKHLSDALRETFRNLDINHVTPELIINRFNKSGGIDRVRIAVERRMKQCADAQKLHTVAASERYLHRAVSDGPQPPHPQKLMQTAQDVVLATVKHRIESDVDSVTEQGKAAWFFECVRDEIINACKGHRGRDPAKAEHHPPPVKPVDSAKAILQNLNRSAARTRQPDYASDHPKLASNKEPNPNGHTDAATNGKLGHDVRSHSAKNENRDRSESMHTLVKEENTVVEKKPTVDQKEINAPPPSSKEDVDAEVAHKSEQKKHLSSGQTEPGGSSEQRGDTSEAVTETKEGPKPMQSKKDEKDFDALAESLLLGGDEDNDLKEHSESKEVKRPVPPSHSEVETHSDKNQKRQTEKTELSEKENLSNPSQESVSQSPTPETNKKETKTDPAAHPKPAEANVAELLSKAPAAPSPEISSMEVEKASIEERTPMEGVEMGAERTKTQENCVDGKHQEERVKVESPSKEEHGALQAQPEQNRCPVQEIVVDGKQQEDEVKAKSVSNENESAPEVPHARKHMPTQEISGDERHDDGCKVESSNKESKSKPDLSHTEDRIAVLVKAGDGKNADASKAESDNKEPRSAPEVQGVQRKAGELTGADVERADSQKQLTSEGDHKCEKEVEVVVQEKQPEPAEAHSGTAEERTNATSDAKSAKVKDEVKEQPHPSNEHEQFTEEPQAKSDETKVSLPAENGAKETPDSGESNEHQQQKSEKEDIPNLTGSEKEITSRIDTEFSQSDGERRRRSESDTAQTATNNATSPTLRPTRLRSSRATPKEESGVTDLQKPAKKSSAQKSGAQKATMANKDRRLRDRPKRKVEESTDRQSAGKRKKVDSESKKSGKAVNEKKRRRSQPPNEQISLPTRRSAQPDPDVENWPRGYGVVKSCVPEDFDAQQKVLHGLRMLLEKAYVLPFSEPVDTSEAGLEMYASVIKNPMDLGEIRKRLENSSAEQGYYLNVSEVMQDIELVWWNCKWYNGQFDPIIATCEKAQQELSFLLEQHGIAVERGGPKRRRVSRGQAQSTRKPEEHVDLGDNDGRLVGKKVMVFTELKKRKKKEWLAVDVKAYDSKSKSYTLLWVDEGKTTRKATFGPEKMYPVYRV